MGLALFKPKHLRLYFIDTRFILLIDSSWLSKVETVTIRFSPKLEFYGLKKIFAKLFFSRQLRVVDIRESGMTAKCATLVLNALVYNKPNLVECRLEGDFDASQMVKEINRLSVHQKNVKIYINGELANY